jgi:hypothetical protein
VKYQNFTYIQKIFFTNNTLTNKVLMNLKVKYCFLFLTQLCLVSLLKAQCSYNAIPSCGSTVTTFASGQTLNSVVCYTPASFTTSTIATLALGNSGGSPGAGTLIVTNADLTITSLTLNASYAGSLYVSSGATVTISNALSMPSVVNSAIVNYGTLRFTNASAITIGQHTKIQTASTSASTSFTGGFTTTSGSTGYFSKGTTTTSGTVTTANAAICLDQNSYWNAVGFSFSSGAGSPITNPSAAFAIINYSGTISNAGGGNISGANLKFCKNGAGATACASITGLGSSSCSSTACANPLPVLYSNFTAKLQGQGVNLVWTTTQEFNNEYFEVERSYDGKHYEAIKKVAGQGTVSSTTTYMMYDDDVNLITPVYYRLKDVDAFGNVDYSSVLVVNAGDQHFDVSVFPNPSDEGTSVYAKLNDGDEGDVQISLYDLTGKLISSYLIQKASNNGIYKIVDKELFLAEGSYLLQIKTNKNLYKEKILVR